MWDPQKYLAYADHRGRPFHELMARVDCRAPRRVVDLGCGPGNLTAGLAERWPNAVIEASDSSQDMVDASRALGLDARLQDAREWVPASDTDVLVSNATLQWIPEHRDLLRRWPSQLPDGAWIAVQVPGNFDAPSHATVRRLAASDRWKSSLDGLALRGSDADNPTVDNPADYAALLSDAGCSVDVWETTYIQSLTGENPVLEWITGTALTPIKTVLPEAEWQQFRADLIPMLDAVYPRRADGSTFFEFRRIFMVARVL